jgi:transposase
MHLRVTNIRPEHAMFTALVSNSQVRLGSLTNTQGSPHNRLAILASQNSGMHVLICNLAFAEVMMKPQSNSAFTAFVGIDWADKKHDFCMQAAGSDQRVFGTLDHSPEAIMQWACSLRDRYGGPIAICVELAKGPLVYALQRCDFFVLFPVHPSTLAKYREAFVPSHAKDDPTDAEMALDILLRHPDKLQPLKLQSVAMRTLAALVEERRGLVNGVVGITNSLVSSLKQYYPQVLDWFEHRDTLIFCDFLSRWPTLRHAKRARRSTLETFFDQHNSRRAYLVEERIQGIRAATALTEDESVIRPNQMLVQALVEQLRALLLAIDRFDAEIDAVAKSLPDYDLFAALPGAGPIQAPRLLVAFGEDRDRYTNAAQIQSYSGVAPVVERSGNKCWVHWRFACPAFLRQTFVEWAGSTIPRSYWAAAYYQQQRSKGCSHRVAVRALAFKWIRILYRCWKTRTPYDESVYLNALRRRGSPLLANYSESANIT